MSTATTRVPCGVSPTYAYLWHCKRRYWSQMPEARIVLVWNGAVFEMYRAHKGETLPSNAVSLKRIRQVKSRVLSDIPNNTVILTVDRSSQLVLRTGGRDVSI